MSNNRSSASAGRRRSRRPKGNRRLRRERLRTGDANDQLYALEASFDYDPGPGLEKIPAPLVAVSSADDLVNPPEIGVLEEITRVPHGAPS